MSGQQGGESPSGTFIKEYTDPPIIDQYGNHWAISQSKQVMIDGEIDRSTSGVADLMYINRMFYQWVPAKRLWWRKPSPMAPWLPPGGTTDSPIGPIPDPRLDTIISAIGSLATADAAAFGGMAARVDSVQAAVDALPPPPPPDARIAALIGAVTRGFTMVHTGLAAIGEATTATQEMLVLAEATAAVRFDAIDAAQAMAATKQDMLAAQANRIIVMLLDLFPNSPKGQITAHMDRGSSEGTQSVPPTGGP